jgi:hypothetical protein
MEIEFASECQENQNKCRFCLDYLNYQEEVYQINAVTRRLFQNVANIEVIY